MSVIPVGSQTCACPAPVGPPVLVALTGGPGAGKTAVLELARRSFCAHVGFLPESAGIVFGGGFPRDPAPSSRRAAQRAIYHVQRSLEGLAAEVGGLHVALCDRGTLDGLAYWPDPPPTFFADLGTTPAAELTRYAAVIHLEVPSANNGYRRDTNVLRLESAREAVAIDRRIAAAWGAHPRRSVVPSTHDFVEKAGIAVARLRAELPPCCQSHPLPDGGVLPS
jgi:hypothetical protein